MMKSIRNLMIGAVAAAGIFAASISAMAATQYVQQNMNFRSGASSTASIIGSVPAGAQVEVLDMLNGWNLIRYNGMTGYIHGGNVADSYVVRHAAPAANANAGQAQAAPQAASSAYKTVSVSSGYLAVRTAPSFNASNEIGKIYSGAQVQITGGYVQGTGMNGSAATYVWVYAPAAGVSGYVNAAYLY